MFHIEVLGMEASHFHVGETYHKNKVSLQPLATNFHISLSLFLGRCRAKALWWRFLEKLRFRAAQPTNFVDPDVQVGTFTREKADGDNIWIRFETGNFKRVASRLRPIGS